MNTETKDLLRSVGINAAGTVLGAGVIALLIFFAGKISLVGTYWKEISLSLVLIFVSLTLIVWFRKLLRMEHEIDRISKQPAQQSQKDYSAEILKAKNEVLTRVNTLSSKLTRLDSDVAKIMRDYLYSQAAKHQAKGQRGALLCRLGVVGMDIKNDSFELDSSLEELSNYIKSENVFSTQDLSEVKDVLVKVTGDGKKEIANHILELIKQKLP